MINSSNGLTTESSSSSDKYPTLHLALSTGVVRLSFKKKDGETREMLCTLNDDLLPKKEVEAKERKKNPDVLAVWDCEKEGWRSFRIDSIITWDVA
jgi:hypothetical protein